MGLDPEYFSTGTSDPFKDDSGVASHQNQYPPQYDDFQLDDIGDYMPSFIIITRISENRMKKILLLLLQNVA
jgi:hypothetical protein